LEQMEAAKAGTAVVAAVAEAEGAGVEVARAVTARAAAARAAGARVVASVVMMGEAVEMVEARADRRQQGRR